MKVITRILSALISSFLICFSIAWVETVPKRDNYSLFFDDNFKIPFIFSTAIFLVIAFPYSLVIDHAASNFSSKRYLREVFALFFYAIGGAITMILFFSFFGASGFINLELILLGGVSAILYYLVIRVMEYITKKKNK